MTNPQILRAADRVAAPWKNGLGVTREIAVHPPGAGLGDFDWRVSMATVTAGGPFSRFPGIDRVLAVLEGHLAVRIDGARIELGPDSPSLSFPGEVPVEAEAPAGLVTDLNLMTRRGRVRGTLERLEIDRPTNVAVSGVTIVLIRTDNVHLDRWLLGADDAVMADRSAARPLRFEPARPSVVYTIRFAAI